MATKIPAIMDERKLEIDGQNRFYPESVFISWGKLCIEVDRRTFLEAVKREFGLEEAPLRLLGAA